MKNFSGGGPPDPPPSLFWTQVKSALGKSLQMELFPELPSRLRTLPTFKAKTAVGDHVPWSDHPTAVDFPSVVDSINAAYAEVVHWKNNLFSVPFGRMGKTFVDELTRLFQAFGERSALEPIALKAAMVLPALVLQRPHASSRAKDHVQCLERRLPLWKAGQIDELVRESRTIQAHLASATRSRNGLTAESFHRTFANLVFSGKLSAAMRLLEEMDSDHASRGVLDLQSPSAPGSSSTVKDVLVSKHPPAADLSDEALAHLDPAYEPVEVHPVLFDTLTGVTIRRAAMRTRGAAGPSGMNADSWRRICSSFKSHSDDLCEALAASARRACTEHVDPELLTALVACRLIPLDKNPGVRPIGICECVRRILGKAILSVVGEDVQKAAGSIQLCAGQPCGIEAAIHAMQSIYNEPDTEGILLVDAKNAFNSLNRRAALINIRWFCPSISTALINIYRVPAQLFVDGQTLMSNEGTTQGDPLAMAMYGLAVLPLIRRIADRCKQTWFADDATGGGRILQLRSWWDALCKIGPSFGYFPNAEKTWLIVKEEHAELAKRVFADTSVQITVDGHRLLGAPLGTPEFRTKYLEERVASWTQLLVKLSAVAQTQPHAAFSAFTHSFVSRLVFMARVAGDLTSHLQPLESEICKSFLPSLSGRPSPSDDVRALLALPARLGGLGIVNPAVALTKEHTDSKEICQPLTDLIIQQKPDLADTSSVVQKRRRAVQERRARLTAEAAASLTSTLPENLQRAVEIASDQGASHWISALPLTAHGFALPKGAFRDALCLRYGWQPPHLPLHCPCGKPFDADHALSCGTGGYSIMRHNEVRDLTASLLSEVCGDVQIEPTLIPLSGEAQFYRSANVSPDARLDVSARGFWGDRFSRTMFDVRVFHPNAPSSRSASVTSQFVKHEKAKRRQYEQRVRDVEGASFVPLVFSTSGGMARAAVLTFKRLASLLSEKLGLSYSATVNVVRCRLSFALLRSAITALRGSRRRLPSTNLQPALAFAEARLKA